MSGEELIHAVAPESSGRVGREAELLPVEAIIAFGAVVCALCG